MQGMTRLEVFDASSLMLRDLYRFISQQAKKLKTDVFETRMFFEKTLCMTGKDAAQLFTDDKLFLRKSAPKESLAATLLGKGGMEGLDGEAHLHRKRLFMSLATYDQVILLQEYLREELNTASDHWMISDEVVLYSEFQQILGRTAFHWIGIELPDDEVSEKVKEISSLFEASPSFRKHIKARFFRKKNASWLGELVKDIRNGKCPHLDGRPIHMIANFRDLDGKLLPVRIAAVEILNFIRPMIFVSVYFVFSLHALSLHPSSRQRILSQEAGFLDNFVNEVRRLYPFFPAITARAKQDFKWGRMHLKKGGACDARSLWNKS